MTIQTHIGELHCWINFLCCTDIGTTLEGSGWPFVVPALSITDIVFFCNQIPSVTKMVEWKKCVVWVSHPWSFICVLWPLLPTGLPEVRGQRWEHLILASVWEVPQDPSNPAGGGAVLWLPEHAHHSCPSMPLALLHFYISMFFTHTSVQLSS